MKTLAPDQTHLLNFGFEAPSNVDANTIHVQFNKKTGDVETVQAIGFSQQKNSNYADVTKRLTQKQIINLKQNARLEYKELYGHFPEHKPASNN